MYYKKIAGKDKTKEKSSLGEPLYEYVRITNFQIIEKKMIKFSCYPKIVGERFRLGWAEFTPCYSKSYYDNLKLDSLKNHFTNIKNSK